MTLVSPDWEDSYMTIIIMRLLLGSKLAAGLPMKFLSYGIRAKVTNTTLSMVDRVA
jgi:hypothetical protein